MYTSSNPIRNEPFLIAAIVILANPAATAGGVVGTTNNEKTSDDDKARIETISRDDRRSRTSKSTL
jgi:hypothetical protein